MSMDKRWGETFDRLQGVEKELRELRGVLLGLDTNKPQTAVTKEQLKNINGVGDATADAILELLNS